MLPFPPGHPRGQEVWAVLLLAVGHEVIQVFPEKEEKVVMAAGSRLSRTVMPCMQYYLIYLMQIYLAEMEEKAKTAKTMVPEKAEMQGLPLIA